MLFFFIFAGLSESFLSKTPKTSLRLHQSDFIDCSVTLNPGEVSRLLDGTPNKSVGFKSVVQGIVEITCVVVFA